ncbi:DUF488 family protein [Diaminobutyricimonas aerilata]|uniref:DUF488 domain-containing protein n=1 Tax=Diaminobutyricimonas aerilata TaxID=1162967 RepID=UPI001FE6EC48|nr:DUF488 domain-containing protein [Diaminobutyricimonas aerilata]
MTDGDGATRTVYTIGHSTRSPDEFVEALRQHGVQVVADVRAVPGSRRNPQFGPEELPRSLAEAGIDYVAFTEQLDGRRYSRVGEPTVNGAWRNHSFRSYADYMQTPGFARGVDALLELADARRVAMMCAEAVPWRCHRSLIGDALVARGVPVADIMTATASRPHELRSFARVDGHRVWYPPE